MRETCLALERMLWRTRLNTMKDLIGEEVKSGRTVHAEVELPTELQARLDALRGSLKDG